MSDPSNPNGDWQQVPGTPADPATPAAAPGYPPPGQGYPPPAQAAYPPPPQGGYPPPQPGYPPPNYPPAAPPPNYAQPASAPMSPTAAGAISYITFIPAVVFLVMEPYKRIPFVKFHSIQSIGLCVLWLLVGIIQGVLTMTLAFAGMWTTMHLINMVIRLVFFLAWLICIIQASQGKWFKLPIIGDFALKQSQKP